MNNFFQFKHFTIEQELCAMKVGTDGVLIGAWGAVGEGRMLDVGCGTGLIAIMAAQRCQRLHIDAIDIDESATRQTLINVDSSTMGNRISVYHSSLQDFAPDYKYDFIISNPPYFINSLKDGSSPQRVMARHSDTLSHSELADGVTRLLNDNGQFSVIFPYVEANLFIAEAARHSLFCFKRMDVRGTPTKPIKRVMLQFARDRREVINDELVIEDGRRHCYTQKYIELTREFYLKF